MGDLRRPWRRRIDFASAAEGWAGEAGESSSHTSATEWASKYAAVSSSELNLGRGFLAGESFFFIRSAYLRRNSRRSLSSMSRAVITRIRPLGKRRNTTQARSEE